jgi:hypothetical protein
LARGLQAGSQTYRGALDAREASLRGIEERRDAFALQNIDAVQKARDEAIALQNAGRAMTREQMELAGMTREDAAAAAIRPFAISEAKSKASKAQTEADTAAETIEAENILKRAQAGYYTAGGGRGGGGGGSGGAKGMTDNQRRTKIGNLQKERRAYTIKLSSPTTLSAERKAIGQAIIDIDRQLADLGSGTPAPAFGPRKQPPAKPIGRIVSSKPIQ